jgi:hypothetical protein
VTPSGDYDHEMSLRLLDDETMDALVAGDPVDPRVEPLLPLADALRTLGDEPLPPVSSALEAVFAESGPRLAGPHEDELAARRRARVMPERVAATGTAARVALVASIAAVGVVVGGISGALPAPIEKPVRQLVEAVTPFELDGQDADAGVGADVEPVPTARSTDAGRTGVPGDDGHHEASASSAGQTDTRRGDDVPEATRSDRSGQTGRGRANETPAGPHLPHGTDPDDDRGPRGGGPGGPPATTAPSAPTTATPPSTTPVTTTTTATTASGGTRPRGPQRDAPAPHP